MGSVSSDQEWLDEVSERFDLESYCLSADVSESETCCSSPAATTNTVHRGGASTSSSPFGGGAFSGKIPVMLPPVVGGRHVIIPLDMPETPETDLDEVELMKERFAKLLLGEDMSGGGKGVCTALAISNAITNLSASVFGQLWKLEPMSPEKNTMWQREMGWLLCVTDNIVELVPSMQEFPGGRRFEVMVPQQRYDLYLNLPALKKLDGMLLSILDGFVNCEFYYVDRGANVSDADENQTFPMSVSSGRPSVRQEEKWWLPFPKVPSNGLSEDTRKRLQQCRECTNQILKAAKAINGNALGEMEIPNAYLESLPKSGKACLGELMYRYITSDQFSPDRLLDYLDLSSEYTTLEIANRIEAAVHIWRQKYLKRHLVCKKNGKSTWGAKVKGFVGEEQRRKLLAKRAEILLHNLRQRFPGLPQTALDVNKIQYNKDVGSAIIESYSRVMESLAFNIMARIDDLLFVDDATKQPTKPTSLCSNHGTFRGAIPKQKQILPTTSHYLSGRGASPYTMQPLDGSHDLIRKFNGRTDHSFNKIKDSLDRTLEKLTF